MSGAMRFLAVAAAIAAGTPTLAAPPGDAAAIARAAPREQIVDATIPPERLAALLAPVDAFYGFWSTGSATLLARAIDARFVDHTLPPGRPQGPTGPAAAAKTFLAAIPDLDVAVVQRLVVGDRVICHLRFTGHFTGSFEGHRGAGQPVDFIATDIVRVRGGRITDNWHIEDNLTLLRQMAIVR